MKHTQKIISTLLATISISILCSCQSTLMTEHDNSTTTEHSSQTTLAYNTIPLPSATETFNEIGTVHEIADMDHTVNENDKYIYGIYDDGEYVVNYNLNYHDYDVSTVSVYSSTYASPSYSRTSGWQFIEYFNTNAPSVNMVNISDVPFIGDFVAENYSDINIHDSVLVATYTLDKDQPVNDSVVITDSNHNDISANFVGTNTVYCIREELDGLPLGCEIINAGLSGRYPRMEYGEEYGTIINGMRGDRKDYYSSDLGSIINISLYNTQDLTLRESELEVMPISDCINNATSGIILDLYLCGAQEADVYSAELLYAMFTLNCYEPWVIPLDTLYIPVWEVSYIAHCNDGTTTYGSVFLDAVTGESYNPELVEYNWN